MIKTLTGRKEDILCLSQQRRYSPRFPCAKFFQNILFEPSQPGVVYTFCVTGKSTYLFQFLLSRSHLEGRWGGLMGEGSVWGLRFFSIPLPSLSYTLYISPLGKDGTAPQSVLFWTNPRKALLPGAPYALRYVKDRSPDGKHRYRKHIFSWQMCPSTGYPV